MELSVYGGVLLDRGLVVAWVSLLDGVRQQSGTAEIRVEDL
jgi:hypothetical protein